MCFFCFFLTGYSSLTSCLGSSPITLQVNVAGGEQATSNSRCSLQSRQGWFITLSALLIAVYKELIELSIHISAGIPGAHVIAGAGSLQELLGLDRPR